MERFYKLEAELKTSIKGLKVKKKFKYYNGVRTLVELNSYNKDGYRIEKNLFNAYGNKSLTTTYTYDKNHRLEMEFKDDDDNLKYYYDEYGRLIKVCSTFHTINNTVTYTYDDTSRTCNINDYFQVQVAANEIICKTDVCEYATFYILDKSNYNILRSYQVNDEDGYIYENIYTYNDNSILTNRQAITLYYNGKKDIDSARVEYNSKGDISRMLYRVIGSKFAEVRYDYKYEVDKTTKFKYRVKADGTWKLSPTDITEYEYEYE